MKDLLSKKCVPCEGRIPPFTQEQIKQYMPLVPGWEVVENKKLQRDFKFKDFKEAMRWVNKVADLAESEGHHPDILIHEWNKVRLDLITHVISGLSENDFIMAAKLNVLR